MEQPALGVGVFEVRFLRILVARKLLGPSLEGRRITLLAGRSVSGFEAVEDLVDVEVLVALERTRLLVAAVSTLLHLYNSPFAERTIAQPTE